jgi:AraC family L-rhamnose operon transcriptional activator RhaR
MSPVIAAPVEHYTWDTFSALDEPIVRNRWLLNHDIEAHDHDFDELAFVLGGTASHRSIYGERELRRGDVLVVGRGAWHAFCLCRDLDVVNVCFRSELVDGELRSALADTAVRALLSPATGYALAVVQLDEETTAGCEAVLHALRMDRARRGLRTRSVARLLLLLGIVAAEADPEAVAATDRVVRARPWVGAAADLLRERHAEPWRLADLADRFSVDPTHLARTFRATFGIPPMAYLARVRAEAAAALLLQTERSVTDIARTVGWRDANYFARRFRAHFGLSPSIYRARRRVGPDG